jgi:hypothetical protein
MHRKPSTREVVRLLERAQILPMGGHLPHPLETAAIQMVRSVSWQHAIPCIPNEPRGMVIARRTLAIVDQASGEIPWR